VPAAAHALRGVASRELRWFFLRYEILLDGRVRGQRLMAIGSLAHRLHKKPRPRVKRVHCFHVNFTENPHGAKAASDMRKRMN
jgi:hypothetical protein